MPKPIALCCSDIHLTANPPVCWQQDAWWGAQEYMLQQINDIAKEHNVTVLASGDIMDRPRMPPKVEVLARKYTQGWYLIPGQHDLPHHNMDLVWESSYGVLTCNQQVWASPPGTIIAPFPWGKELVPYDEWKLTRSPDTDDIKIALIHATVWQGTPPYPGAPVSGNVVNISNVMKGYDFLVFGDNHKSFVTQIDGTTIVNCGSTMRRTVAQLNYQPLVHLLFDDKSVQSIPLDISKDKVSAEHKEKEEARDDRISAYVETLTNEVEISLSYESNMNRHLEANNVEPEVVTVIREEMV